MKLELTEGAGSTWLLRILPIGIPTLLFRLLTTNAVRAIRKATEHKDYDFSEASEYNFLLCFILDVMGIIIKSEDVPGFHKSREFHLAIDGGCLIGGIILQAIAGFNDTTANKYNNFVTVVILGYMLYSNASVVIRSKNRLLQLLVMILLVFWLKKLWNDIRQGSLKKNSPTYQN